MFRVQYAFQAPDEGTGTDAILVAANIGKAESEGDFSASSNATSLKFTTASSLLCRHWWNIYGGEIYNYW